MISSGRPVAEVARDLGINEGTLGTWVNKAKRDGAFKEKPLKVNERARLKELEEENRRLKMERDLLKKVRVVCEPEPVKFAFIEKVDEDDELFSSWSGCVGG
ncbi:transposase [Amycolatopsis taiwanensis]|uniref:transposase n=1 Tax=Amycolatopsis taiwanensis TaxID=342230 RepID=UPI0007C4643C